MDNIEEFPKQRVQIEDTLYPHVLANLGIKYNIRKMHIKFMAKIDDENTLHRWKESDKNREYHKM